MVLLPAWAIDGEDVPAAMARRTQWVATQGATGITLPTDLRVVPRAPAGPGVRIMPGGCTMENHYPGAAGESYGVYNDAALDVPVAPTGSASGRTDFLGVRVDDPQFAGSSANQRPVLVAALPSTYPFVPLAKITQPANNAVITAAMIQDLRQVANPRTLMATRPKAIVAAGTETLAATGADGEWFPNGGGEQEIFIPSWATRMQIRGEWLQVRYAAGNAFGRCWVEYGPYARPSTRQYSTQQFQWDSAAASNVSRANWFAVDDVAIPAALRGTTQVFVLKARVDASVAAGSRPGVDAVSGCNLEVRFFEVADSSDS
jgi:hypothetical protein